MKKEEIKNNELKRLIAMKADKIDFADVSDEDIEQIEDITLNAYLINGKKSEIDLNVLSVFTNLQRVKISNFEIDENIINLLSELQKLKSVEMAGCSFKDIDFSKLNGKIENFSFINCEELHFKYPEVKDIRVVNSKIDFKNIDFKNIQNVFIQSSNIQNVHHLNDFPDIKTVNLDGSKLYDEEKREIQDIEVGEKTIYTHERNVYYYDGRS